MFCNKCGASLPDGSNVCSFCGASIRKKVSPKPGNVSNVAPGSRPGNIPSFTPNGPNSIPSFTPNGPNNVPSFTPNGPSSDFGNIKPVAVGKAVRKPSGKSALIISIAVLSVLTIAIVSAIIIVIAKRNKADSQTANGKSDKIEASADNDNGSSKKQNEITEKNEAATIEAAASEKSDAVTTETAITEGTTMAVAAASEESTYEESTSEEASSEVNITEELTEASMPSPFYGIWCFGTKYESDAEDFAAELRANGFESHVFVTTDWSDLNSEKYYVVSAGVFSSESDAESDLERVHSAGYSDAYVKYSGDYIGE